MAFSILSAFIRGHRTKYVSTPTKGDATPVTGGAVLRKTMPSQSLFDTKNPMPWVDSVSTDIRRWKK